MSYRILIVEDDRGIAEAIAQQVALWEMQPRIAENFRDIMEEFAAFDPQLVLLDIVLPFFNGYHWCSEIRRVSKVPVLFLSSASDNMNIVMAMNMGGDDFIAKPFDQNVLIAKIQALLRRSYDFAQKVPVLCHRGVVLHTGEQTLHFEGEQIPLTKNEYRILLTLMTNKGRIVSREKLMEAIWKTDDYIDENTLSVNVNRLRKKLSAAGCPELIETKVGVGYMLAM